MAKAPEKKSPKTSEPLVSVVTPFHDTGEYLAECIESVLSQTYRNFEYLLVDNQSTDQGGAIAADYARRDPRIRFLTTKELLKQVPNYNFALRNISPSSAYVKIVQADDAIFPPCLEEMVALAEANPRVTVVSSYELRGTTVIGSGLPHDRCVLSGRDACRLHMLEHMSLFGTPTTVMMRASVVRARDPFYEEGRYFEDTEVMYEILRDADFGFVHQVLSFNRVREGSLWSQFRAVDPLPLSELTLATRYGRTYLTEDEFKQHFTRCHDAYFKMLARSWIQRPSQRFIDFHRKGLADIGDDISRAKLARYAAAALWDEVFPSRLLFLFRKLRALASARGGEPTA